MSCDGVRMADQSAGRVSLHPCFLVGLSTASDVNTGEGGTPALFVSPKGGAKMRTDDKIVKLARSAKRSGIKLPFNVIADALDQDHRYMGVRIGST